ncbi:MAG: aspartate 1-decarboxylase [Bacteroidetes bacterium]|nr:MAG: aspartate 1-decarboxylase [Bacteroidota bacterium]
MFIQVVKSKIHRVRVTQAELNYIGSITIDESLMIASGLLEGERVQIVDVNNGERFETYVIKGEKDSGTICLNGPAARKVAVDDIIIIIGYGFMTPEEAQNFKPKLVFPDEQSNRIRTP